jgi:hypothetical protein
MPRSTVLGGAEQRRGAAWRLVWGLALAVAVAACHTSVQMPAPAASDSPPGEPSPSRRGEYLVETSGCHNCHTSTRDGPTGPQTDRTRMLAGHPAGIGAIASPAAIGAPWVWAASATNTAFAGHWGVSYAINLTPDATGLGEWTEEEFVRALRTGRHKGVGRAIVPPMPWRAYARFSDADLRAIFSYLRTLPAIVNRVPEIVPAVAR